jgi:hypothetical protein
MSRINSIKIQQKVSRQESSLDLHVNPAAPYQVSVCICVDSADTSHIENIEKLMKYFSKSYVVFLGKGETSKRHCLFIANSFGRNAYLSFVVSHRSLFDIMMVVDSKLSLYTEIPSSSFSCCSPERLPTWDAVFANQSYKYYDVASLRSETCPTDMSELDENTRIAKINSLKIHISKHGSLIPVKSAFGGLALYKVKHLVENTYSSEGHVTFNLNYYNNGGVRMFLDPSLLLETPVENAYLYL